jgi:hypothetical protein
MSQYNTANKANNEVMTLSFNGNDLNPVKREGQIWMTSADLAKALGYEMVGGITKLYNRNKSEFSDSMTQMLDLTHVPEMGRTLNSGAFSAKTRIFSLRGCHLIAMFSRTKIAKDFRKWVLDILDREAGVPVADQPPAITDADWVRYSRSMTIPEMAQLTGHNEREVVNALHKVMGSPVTATNPAPVMTPELQYALDQFWRFVATQDLAKINHSHKAHELAISIPDIYALAEPWELPDTSLLYKALRLSDTPRFHRANTVMASALLNKSRRVWVFIKSSFGQPAITKV